MVPGYIGKAAMFSMICRILFLSSIVLFAQQNNGPVSLFNHGKSLFESGEYFNSVTELKRYLFFDSVGAHRYEANLLIAKAYRTGGFYDIAGRYFSNARNISSGSSEYLSASIELSKNELLRNNPENSLEILRVAENRHGSSGFSNEIAYWRSIALIFNQEYEKGAALLDSLFPGDSLAILAKTAADDKVNPAFIRLMSAILPGSGQIYLGEYTSGILSLGWTGFWGYIMVNAISENRIFDGLMTGNFLFSRFYNGNLKNTLTFAENHNISVRNKLLQFFNEKYIGKKPEW